MADNDIKKHVLDFAKKQIKFKKVKEKFDNAKEEFNASMDEFFDRAKDKSKLQFVVENGGLDSCDVGNAKIITVSRVQKSSVVFDVEELERNLPKSLRKRVINKSYTIIDFEGLSAYLKSCGVNPKEFKKYVSVEKSIDADILDNLDEIGKINLAELSSCYTINKQKPYYSVKIKEV